MKKSVVIGTKTQIYMVELSRIKHVEKVNAFLDEPNSMMNIVLTGKEINEEEIITITSSPDTINYIGDELDSIEKNGNCHNYYIILNDDSITMEKTIERLPSKLDSTNDPEFIDLLKSFNELQIKFNKLIELNNIE